VRSPAFVAVLIRFALDEPKIFLEKKHARRKFQAISAHSAIFIAAPTAIAQSK
jgi:hypothetical protein